MMTYETKIKIERSVDEVFTVLTDLNKSKDWMTGLETIKIVSGTLNEVGSKLQLVFNENGKPVIFEEELLSIRKNESLGFELNNKHVQMTTEIYLKKVGVKTEILMINAVRGKGFFMKLTMPFLKKMMINRQMKDLNNLKNLMED